MAIPGRGATTAQQAGAAGRPAAVPATRPRDEDEPGPLFLVPAYAVLLILGATLGVLGSFFLAAGPRSGGTLLLPVGLLIALIGHPVAVLLGLWTTGTRAGTLTPLIGWSMVVLPLSVGTAEGDVILPGNTLSIGFLLVGLTTFGVTAFLTRPTRGQTAVRRR